MELEEKLVPADPWYIKISFYFGQVKVWPQTNKTQPKRRTTQQAAVFITLTTSTID